MFWWRFCQLKQTYHQLNTKSWYNISRLYYTNTIYSCYVWERGAQQDKHPKFHQLGDCYPGPNFQPCEQVLQTLLFSGCLHKNKLFVKKYQKIKIKTLAPPPPLNCTRPISQPWGKKFEICKRQILFFWCGEPFKIFFALCTASSSSDVIRLVMILIKQVFLFLL